MQMITFIRNSKTVLNPDNVPSHIIDALDELFYEREWDFVKIIYEGEYDAKSDIFTIKSMKDEYENDISIFFDGAWDCLDRIFKKHIIYNKTL